MEIISRKEALKIGQTNYYTGRPCKNGHTDLRNCITRNCLTCTRMKASEFSASVKGKIYRSLNRHKQDKFLARERSIRFAQNNPAKVRANTRRQQAARLKRVPSWSEIEAIEKFYEDCPVGMEVDHILPLQGKLVSGLHVLSNLQYLDPIEK